MPERFIVERVENTMGFTQPIVWYGVREYGVPERAYLALCSNKEAAQAQARYLNSIPPMILEHFPIYDLAYCGTFGY